MSKLDKKISKVVNDLQGKIKTFEDLEKHAKESNISIVRLYSLLFPYRGHFRGYKN